MRRPVGTGQGVALLRQVHGHRALRLQGRTPPARPVSRDDLEVAAGVGETASRGCMWSWICTTNDSPGSTTATRPGCWRRRRSSVTTRVRGPQDGKHSKTYTRSSHYPDLGTVVEYLSTLGFEHTPDYVYIRMKGRTGTTDSESSREGLQEERRGLDTGARVLKTKPLKERRHRKKPHAGEDGEADDVSKVKAEKGGTAGD